jgi:hypothetical protein
MVKKLKSKKQEGIKKPQKIVAKEETQTVEQLKIDDKRSKEIEDILAEIEKNDKIEHLKEKENGEKEKISRLTYTTPLRLYRRIALFFTLTTIVILVFALYFALSKAEIIITPHKYLINSEFNVNVESMPLSENSINGKVIEDVRSDSMEFEIAGEGEVKEGIAKGEVTLINETSSSQTLVKTTRLLSPEGILFRLGKQVIIPPHGSVVAPVYADKAGESGDIGPTKFTIPGLNVSLQDKIYAISKEPMHGGKIVVKIVKEDDINNAKNVLKEKIISEAKESLNKLTEEGNPTLGNLPKESGIVFWPEVLEEKCDAKVGEAREKFEVSMKVRVLGIFYDKSALEKMVREKVNLIIPAERSLQEILFGDVKIDLVKYDASTASAVLKVTAPAKIIVKDSAPIFDKQQLVGLKKDDAKKYLENFEEIESVKINTRPFWLRRLPSLAERIEIYIQ